MLSALLGLQTEQACCLALQKAAVVLDEMLEQVMQELFVEQAASYLAEEAVELSECQAIRNAVSERMAVLDTNFLAALNGYIQVAASREEVGLAELLEAIRDEVLRQVADHLPPAARVVDVALTQLDKDMRLKVLRTAIATTTTTTTTTTSSADDRNGPATTAAGNDSGDGDGDGGGEAGTAGFDRQRRRLPDLSSLPGEVPLEGLLATVGHMIDEMEEHQEVPDRRLLARLCLVREEVRMLEREAAFGPLPPDTADPCQAPGLNSRFTRGNVPHRCVTFLKELLVVNNAEMRLDLLGRALSQDWDGAAPRPKVKAHQQEQEQESRSANSGGAGPSTPPPDFVRPGRFMTTLHSMQSQLEQAHEQGGAAASPLADPEQRGRVARRLADIQHEAMTVLDRIQRGQL
ncbi:hypothetical protein V8C86DRAFT_3094409 [Haematococcus lacustris]